MGGQHQIYRIGFANNTDKSCLFQLTNDRNYAAEFEFKIQVDNVKMSAAPSKTNLKINEKRTEQKEKINGTNKYKRSINDSPLFGLEF